MALLYTQVQYSMFVGFGLLILLAPVNGFVFARLIQLIRKRSAGRANEILLSTFASTIEQSFTPSFTSSHTLNFFLKPLTSA